MKTTAHRFVAIPVSTISSPEYRALSFSARALLMDIAQQYDGTNAASLKCNWSRLRDSGWTSQATIHKAKADLIASGLLVHLSGHVGSGFTSNYTLPWLQ